MSKVFRAFVTAPVAVLLPPLAVYLMSRNSVGFYLNLSVFVLAQAIFWFLFAGPGLALWMIAVMHAVLAWIFWIFSRVRAN